MKPKYLAISIDTEVDKSSSWAVSDPATFLSVTRVIPEVLTPLFGEYAAKPTYLLSPEVIEDPECSATLRDLGTMAELGTHLHVQFIGPNRELFPGNMAGRRADSTQAECDRELEREKLRTLTELFTEVFGYPPTAFRAGRFAMSEATLDILAELGYLVDSSVTPGIYWNLPQGKVDYRRHSAAPTTIDTDHGPIVELPVTTKPLGRLARAIGGRYPMDRVYARLTGNYSGIRWLRPTWCSASEMDALAETSESDVLVMMLHNNELIPGASPYARDQETVQRILDALAEFLNYAAENEYEFVTLTEAASAVATP